MHRFARVVGYAFTDYRTTAELADLVQRHTVCVCACVCVRVRACVCKHV